MIEEWRLQAGARAGDADTRQSLGGGLVPAATNMHGPIPSRSAMALCRTEVREH
jgi:hypothetical protein